VVGRQVHDDFEGFSKRVKRTFFFCCLKIETVVWAALLHNIFFTKIRNNNRVSNSQEETGVGSSTIWFQHTIRWD
jgi:hypothetical protein